MKTLAPSMMPRPGSMLRLMMLVAGGGRVGVMILVIMSGVPICIRLE